MLLMRGQCSAQANENILRDRKIKREKKIIMGLKQNDKIKKKLCQTRGRGKRVEHEEALTFSFHWSVFSLLPPVSYADVILDPSH